MDKLERLLVGITWAVAICKPNFQVFGESTQSVGKYCHRGILVENYDPETIVECTNKSLAEVPKDLPTKIKILRFYENPKMTLTKNSFKQYNDLDTLTIQNENMPKNGVDAHELAFYPLNKLNKLHLLNTGYSTLFKWPSNLKYLLSEGNQFANVDASNLYQLEKLVISNSDLHDLPKLHKSSPTVFFESESNPMTNLTAESLADYCVLQTLTLSLQLPERATKEKYCRCARIVKWIERIKKDTNKILHGKIDIDCGDPSKSNGCSFDFTQAEEIIAGCRIAHNKPVLAQMHSSSQIPYSFSSKRFYFTLSTCIFMRTAIILRRLQEHSRID